MLTDYIVEQFTVSTELKEHLERSEKGDAELFVQMFDKKVAYDHSSQEWNIWRGHYWELDRKREAFELVMNRVAAEYLQQAKDLREQGTKKATELSDRYIDHAKLLLARRRVENVLHIASSDPALALTGDEWDRSPDLLAVNNGVIDLLTGLRRDGQPTDYIRVHAPVDWMGLDYPCPVWEKTLGEIFNQDQEMIAFIQRLFGQAITGHTTEHKLPIFVGDDGSNGKTTIFETLRAVLGNGLCISIPSDSLMETRLSGDSAQPFLYELRGKRLAYASESKDGQKINASLVKQLTGGDTLNVRTLYTKPVMFQPTHKIMLFTNRKPAIPADDQAAWDRVLLIKMDIRFVDNPTKPNERKKELDLKKKLKAEYSAILAWLVHGSLEWQKQGLNPPTSVRVATEAYREEEDTLALFLSETHVDSPKSEIQARQLYKDYQGWANGYGITPINQTAFGKRMKLKLQFEERRNVVFYKGIVKKM